MLCRLGQSVTRPSLGFLITDLHKLANWTVAECCSLGGFGGEDSDHK